MTQCERTEAVIGELQYWYAHHEEESEGAAYRKRIGKLHTHLRSLAEKIDRIMAEVPEPTYDTEHWRAWNVHEAVRAIVESDSPTP